MCIPSTNTPDRRGTTELLLKVALNTIKQTTSKTIFNATRMMTFGQLQPILGINQPEMSCLL
jgi:hypothetical protein